MSRRNIPRNYVVDQDYSTVKAFTDTSGITAVQCTIAIETNAAKSFYGGTTLKITEPAVNNTYFHVTFPIAFDDNALSYDFAIWVEDPTIITSYRLNLSSVANFAKEMRRVIDGVYLVPGWNVFKCTKSSFVSMSSESFGNKIAYARFQFQISGSVPFDHILIDTLYYGKKELPNILFTVDDSIASARSIIQPYMASKGMNWTLYARLHWQGTTGKLTDADLKYLYDNGVHIGNHTMNHLDMTTLTNAEIESEIDPATQKLISLGITKDIDHIAYPYGKYTDYGIQHVKKQGFKTGRTTNNPQPNFACEYANNPNGMYVLRTFVDTSLNTTTFEGTLRPKIDTCLHDGGTIIILTHDVANPGTVNAWDEGEFKKTIDYIDGLGLKTKSMAEWYECLTSPRKTVSRS